MVQRNKKDKKNIEEWLLGFENLVDNPVVISVLVEEGNIKFLSCLDKKRYLDHDSEGGEDEEIGLEFKDHKKKLKYQSMSECYFG